MFLIVQSGTGPQRMRDVDARFRKRSSTACLLFFAADSRALGCRGLLCIIHNNHPRLSHHVRCLVYLYGFCNFVYPVLGRERVRLQVAEPRHLNARPMVAPGVFLLRAPSAVDLAGPDKSQIVLPEGHTLGALSRDLSWIAPGSRESGGGRSRSSCRDDRPKLRRGGEPNV